MSKSYIEINDEYGEHGGGGCYTHRFGGKGARLILFFTDHYQNRALFVAFFPFLHRNCTMREIMIYIILGYKGKGRGFKGDLGGVIVVL